MITVVIFFATALLSGLVTAHSAPPVVNRTSEPVVIYDEALSVNALERLVKVGGRRYSIVYQDNCDKAAKSTGTIDIPALARYVAERPSGFPSEWAVLDYEMPFDDWIREGPGSAHWKTATDSMVAAIERMKALFPGVKWTYYGVPRLEYYIDGKTWASATDAATKAEIERQFQRYAPIIAKCDWLAPSVYMMVGDRKDGGRPGDLQQRETRAWTRAVIESAIDFGRRVGNPVPVVPFVSPVYQPGGGARNQAFIPSAVIDECTIRPIVEAGGSGVCIWTAGSYIVSQVTAPLPVGKAPDPDITPVLRQWSEDLRVPESTLQSPDGIADLRRRFADGTAGFAENFVKVWAARRGATVPAPPLSGQPAPPRPSEPAKTAPR
jgi:hypothetical protein